MSTSPDSIQKQAPVPHCPHCDTEFAGMGMYTWTPVGWLLVGLYCPECLKTLHFSSIPFAPGNDEPSRIPMPS
jgi:hypothetical protein